MLVTQYFITYPLFNVIEFSQHKVDINEDNGEAKSQISSVTPDGARGNLTKRISNIHLVIKILLC